MTNIIGYCQGPVANGSDHTLAWNDRHGFHLFYAIGYETDLAARLAAVEGASQIGYIEPRWWEFWKFRSSTCCTKLL